MSVKEESHAVIDGEGAETLVMARAVDPEPSVDERPMDLPEGEKRLKLLATIGDILRTSADENDLLYLIASAVGRYFDAQRCLFNEIDLENDLEMIHRDYFTRFESVAGRHKISDYSDVTSADMKAGKTVVNNDSKTDPRTRDRYKKVYGPAGERSYVTVPLMRGNQWVASLWLSCGEPRDWDEADVRLLEMIAERTWLAVEKSRHETAMRKSEERFSLFMQHLPGLAWIKDCDGRYVYANDPAVAAFGTARETLYGKTDPEVFPPETADAFVKNDRRVVGQNSSIQSIESLRQPDGVMHHSVVTKFPIPGEDGRPSMVGGMAIDITDQRRAEIALRDKEAELQILADTTPVALIRCERDLTVKFINRAGAELFGREYAQIVGRQLAELIGEERVATIHPHLENVLAGDRVSYEAEVSYPADGPRSLNIHLIPDVDANGAVIGFVASLIDITDLRSAQQATLQNALLLDLSAEPIFAWDLERGILQWNKGAEMLYGYTRDEAIGQSSHSLLGTKHPDGAEHFVRELEQNGEWSGEVIHRTKEGVELIIESRQQLLETGAGRIVLESNHDVTVRRRAERALRESEARSRLAQRAGGVGIWDWNILENKTYWSETTWDFYGEAPESAVPNEEFWTVHLHPEDRDRVRQNLYKTVLSRQSNYRDEFRILRRDGSILWIESSASVSRDPDGRATRIFGVNIDITTRREAEERVRASAQQLRLVTDAMPALISYVDCNERFRFANQAYHTWFDQNPEKVIGKRVKDFFGPTVYAVIKRYVREALEGNDVSFESAIQYKVGPPRFVHICYTPDIDTDGSVKGYFALTTDLSDLKRSQEELQRAHDLLEVRVAERTRELAESNRALIEEAKARTAAEEQRIHLLHRLVGSQEMERRRIARDIHDQLGQRLTGLRLKLESLRSILGDDGEVVDRVRRLQEISEKLDGEVSFLAWELRPTALDDLGLAEALHTFAKEWSRHTDIAADFQAIKVGRERFDLDVETHLYRIAQEALNNISKHAGAENVTVILEKREEELILIIEDDGHGFDPAAVGTPSKSGRGLGLLGMRERAALIGGNIEIESSQNGTAIYVRVRVFKA
jgi:PAS domain S-box-containing protein